MNIFICLVGSNSLPNYVVCKYLLMDNRNDLDELPKPDKIIFVYSNDTYDYFRHIVEILKIRENQYCKVNLGSKKNIRKRGNIVSKINKELNKINNEKNISSIHLNFTGGTKPMSVYSYTTVKEFTENKKINFISSDLDPNTYKFKVNRDSDDNEMSYPNEDDLRKKVTLNMQNLFELHNMKIDKKGYKEARYNFNLEKYKKYFNRTYRNKLKEFNDYMDKYKKEIKNIELKKSELKKIIQNTFDDILRKKLDTIIINLSSIDEIKNFGNYLYGFWLEDYILECIKSLPNEYEISSVRSSVKAKYKSRDCEIDVIAIKGYELFLFSCTTSKSIRTVKLKAFEVMYRADQLGGEHAKSIIVNMMPEVSNFKSNNKNLEKDLSSFNAKQNIEIISLEDIIDKEKLINKLKKIFE